MAFTSQIQGQLCQQKHFQLKLTDLVNIINVQNNVQRHVLNVEFYAIFVSFICYLCCKAASINEYSILL